MPSEQHHSQLLKLVQLNANHARAATAALDKYAHKNKIDIVLLQDPYLQKVRPQGFPRKRFASTNK